MATQPRTISQRIALIGAEEIAKKLEQIGASGEKAFKGINAEVETSVRRLETFVSAVARVETAFARIGAAARGFGDRLGLGTQLPSLIQAINQFDNAVGRAARNAALLLGGGGLLGAAAVGIARFATGAAQSADALEENAQAAGLTAEAYTRLQFATESAGLKQAQFGQTMGRLNDQFLDAQKAQNAFAQAAGDGLSRTDEEVKKLVADVTKANNLFTRLGVDVRNIGLEEAILRAGDALRRLPSDVQRVQVGVDTLGNRAGPRAVQAFTQLREVLRATGRDINALQAPPELRRIGQEAAQSLDVLSRAAALARERLGLVFAGNVREAATGLTRAIIANIGPLEEFAKTVEQRVASVIRDLIRLLSGQEADVENRWIVEWRDAIVEFGATVQRVFTSVVAPAFRGLMALLDRAAETINRVFGTNLSGGDIAILAILGRITGAFNLIASAATVALAAVAAFFSGIRLGLAVLAGLAAIAGAPATIAAAFAAAAALIITNWQSVRTVFKELGIDVEAAERAWKSFEAATGGEQINSVAASIETVTTALGRFNERISQGVPFWESFKQFLQEADPLLNSFINLVERAAEAVSRLRQLRQLPTHDEAANLKVQADQINEEARQRARLGQETAAAAEIEREYAEQKRETARAVALSAQAEQQAAQATVQAARATAQATQVTNQAAQVAEQEARARVAARQAEQNALREAARAAKALAPDLATPFKTAGDEAAKLGQQTRALPDLATPFKTFGDEAERGVGRAGQATKTLPPIFVEVGEAATQAGQTAVTGLDPIVAKVEQITKAVREVGQPAATTVPTVEAPAAAGGTGPFGSLIEQAKTANQQIVEVFRNKLNEIAQAISGGTAGGVGAVGVGAGTGPFASLISAAQSAAQQIVAIFTQLGQSIGQAIGGGGPAAAIGEAGAAVAVGAGLGGPFATLVAQAQQAAAQVLAIFQALGQRIPQAVSGTGVVPATAAPAEATAAAATPAATIAGTFSLIVTQAQQAAQQIVQIFAAVGPSLAAALQSGLQAALGAFQSVAAQIPQFFFQAANEVDAAFQQMAQSAEAAAQRMVSALQTVVQAAQQAAAELQQVQAGGGAGFARGGFTGPGPRSEPAGIVHRGEYVQPKHIVRKPGVLGFMELLRRTGDLEGAINRFVRGFDMGGLVPSVRPAMAYAGGGFVAGSGTVGPRNLGTLFLKTDAGQTFRVFADEDVAAGLTRFAVRANIASAGRPPSRVG